MSTHIKQSVCVVGRFGVLALFSVMLVVFYSPTCSASDTTDVGTKAWAVGDYETAIRSWQESAKKGDPVAQYNLGWSYLTGTGVIRDKEKSQEWFTKAASQGDEDAQQRLIEELIKHTGSPKIYQKLDYWLAAITDDPTGKLVELLQKSGRGDDFASDLILGILYQNGEVLGRDELMSLEYFLRAASHGIATAQTRLGALYEKGQDIPRDYEAAADWYLKAAEQGYREAQYSLAELYFNGGYFSRNPKEALRWYLEAESLGETRARIRIGYLFQEKNSSADNLEVALQWFRKAEKAGDLWARYKIAEMHYFGQGVEQDLDTALLWLKRMIESDPDLITRLSSLATGGDLFAQIGSGYLHLEGGPDLKNTDKAFEYFYSAALQDDWFAQRSLGRIYADGDGVVRDLDEAINWYNKAASNGDHDSKLELIRLKVLAQTEAEEEKKRLIEEEKQREIARAEEKKKRLLEEQKQRELAKAEEKRKTEQAKKAKEDEEENKKREEKVECFESAQTDETMDIIGSGTGFVVNHAGYAVTNYHVIEDCQAISTFHKGDEYWAVGVADDPINDLAIVRTCRKFPNVAHFRSLDAPLKQGEEVVSYGYPLAELFRLKPKITSGIINSLSGFGNDSGVMQHSAPTQPGNSGGPLMDLSGNVIGVVNATIKKKYSDDKKFVPQNINFAIKMSLVKDFLDSNGIDYSKDSNQSDIPITEIAEMANRFTMLIGCYGKVSSP